MANSAVIDEKQDVWAGGVAPMGASYGKIMIWFFLVSDAFTFSGLLVAYGFDRFKHVANDIVGYIPSAEKWPIPEKVYNAFPFMGHVDMPLVFVGLMTFILILSSVTMVLAVEAGQRMDKAAVEKWMLWTILGGIMFLSCQAWEWMHFIHGTESVVQLFSNGFNGDYAKLLGGASFVNGEIIINNVEHLKLLVPGDLTLIGQEAKEMLINAKPIEGANLVINEYGPPVFADFFFFITGFHGTHVLSGIILNVIVFFNASTGIYQQRGHYEMVEKVGLYWHFVDLVWVFVFTFFYLV